MNTWDGINMLLEKKPFPSYDQLNSFIFPHEKVRRVEPALIRIVNEQSGT